MIAYFAAVITVLFLLMLLLKKTARRPCLHGPFTFFEEDDSDIKIAGQEPRDNCEEDAAAEADELLSQRQNGNLEKARLLGAALAAKLIGEDGESSFGQDSSEDGETRAQRRLLLAFTVFSTIEDNIKSKVLQGVISNVFYDSLKKANPGFYDDINESGSFSFYTLCVRRGKDVENGVGRTFAMLTGKEGDSVMEELGKALYLRFVDVTSKTIQSFEIKQ